MKRRIVEISADAKADLIKLYDRIADAVSPTIALLYIERLEDYISAFDVASERGHSREDLRP